MYQLRDYQSGGVSDMLEFYNSKSTKKALVVAPTGAGKSLYIAAMADTVKEPILVLQPTKELLEQNYAKYLSYGNEASIYSASLGSKEIGEVTFATPGSLKGKGHLFKDVKLVLIDEAHLATKRRGVVDRFLSTLSKQVKVIGLTATPLELASNLEMGPYLKMINRSRKNIFNHIIHITQIKEVVKKKYWCDVEYDLHTPNPKHLRPNSGGSFTEESVVKFYESNNLLPKIVGLLNGKYNKKKVLVFVPSVEVANTLSRMVKNSASISSKTPKKERPLVVDGFRSGNIRVVFNVNILAVGFDYPELEVVMDAAPSMSIARVYQKWGRVVRPHKSKQKGVIIDLAGNYQRFGDIRNLKFEDVPGQGWAMTSKNRLLTNVPIDGEPVMIEDIPNPEILTFGKHEGKTAEEVVSCDRNYADWMLENFDWGRKKPLEKALKKAITDLEAKAVKNKIEVFFDGSCAPGPGGNMGTGFLVKLDGEVIKEHSNYFPAHPINSSPRAESISCLEGVEWVMENGYANYDITVFGDNQTVIKQANRQWRVNPGKTTTEIMNKLLNILHIFPKIKFVWLPREQNKEADVLSAKILEQKNLIVKRR